MSTSQPNPYGIEPKLLGTRYGAALEAAAKARLYQPQWEQQQRDEWMKAHPECVSSTPLYPLAAEQKPAKVDAETAAKWAQLLSRLSDAEYRSVKGRVQEARRPLLAQGYMEYRMYEGRFQYRRTTSGTKWLEGYYAEYQQSLIDQANEDMADAD